MANLEFTLVDVIRDTLDSTPGFESMDNLASKVVDTLLDDRDLKADAKRQLFEDYNNDPEMKSAMKDLDFRDFMPDDGALEYKQMEIAMEELEVVALWNGSRTLLGDYNYDGREDLEKEFENIVSNAMVDVFVNALNK